MQDRLHVLPEQRTLASQAEGPLQSIVPVAASLLTPPEQDESPLHVAVHWSPWQVTALAQLAAPAQVICSTFPPPWTPPAQLLSPVQRT